MPTFGERLKQLRKEKSLKQIDIAKLLEVSERTVRFYELNEREPTISQSSQLAQFFNVPLDYLSGRSDDRTPPERSDVSPEEAEFLKWVEENLEGTFFYDFHKLSDKKKRKIIKILDVALGLAKFEYNETK